MTAEELWKKTGIEGTYEAWSFGDAPDKLAELVVQGIKTATCSAYDLYQIDHEPLPQAGDYSIILNSDEEAVCVIKTLKVYVTEFKNVSVEHAFKEGEGDRSLEYWRMVHESFLINELASVHRTFTENTKVVCEEFEVLYRYDPLYEAGWNNTDTRKPPLRLAGRSGSCGKGTASALGNGIRERYIT